MPFLDTKRTSMRARKLGRDTRVTVSAAEVAAFRASWPCSGLPDTSIGFTFDHQWDLVDMSPDNVDGEAVLALSHTAEAYGQRKTKQDTK